MNSEELWKKELRIILERDIHEKGLGCCVNDTHIKVGDVHLGKFYEAQFLFGNAYWISIFSNALKMEIACKGYKKNEKILHKYFYSILFLKHKKLYLYNKNTTIGSVFFFSISNCSFVIPTNTIAKLFSKKA